MIYCRTPYYREKCGLIFKIKYVLHCISAHQQRFVVLNDPPLLMSRYI